MRVLVTNVKNRKSFDIVSCLWRLGYLTVITEGSSRHLFRLAHGQKIYQLQTTVYEDFEEDLLRLLQLFSDEELVYIPCEEHTTLLFLQFVERNRNERLRYCLPSSSAFELARHEKKLSQFCNEKKFPCPQEFSQRTSLG